MAVFGFFLIEILEGRSPSLGFLFLPFLLFLAVPVVVLMLFVKLGLVSDIHVYKRNERGLSYTIAVASALIFMVITQVESWFYRHWGLSVLLTLVALMLVNWIWMKASAHMAGLGGFMVFTLFAFAHGLSPLWCALAVVLAGLVYISRKGLSAHSHIELIAGFSLGLLVTFVTFRI